MELIRNGLVSTRN